MNNQCPNCKEKCVYVACKTCNLTGKLSFCEDCYNVGGHYECRACGYVQSRTRAKLEAQRLNLI